jgi:NitT/TauT family transport system substrate-binding protein
LNENIENGEHRSSSTDASVAVLIDGRHAAPARSMLKSKDDPCLPEPFLLDRSSDRESSMRMLRFFAPATALVLALLFVPGTAHAESNTIRVGKVIGGDGFHIPSYVAMDQGFYKAEGLDAHFVVLQGRPLVTAALSGNVDVVPIPSGGAQAALSGADIIYIVGESLKSQWTIVVPKSINKVEDLKGKTVGYGRAGGADYDEGASVLQRFFHMEVGKDYKVISFQSEQDRIAALINGDIQGALLSVPHAAKAAAAGMKVLLRTGDYIPRAGGTFWGKKEFVDQNPETAKKFIRAIARAVMYFRDNKAGSIPTLKNHLGISNDQDAGAIWDQLRNSFGAELPKDQFRHIFESRRETMIAARQWPADKPLPDPERFVARNLLDPTLKDMGYIPTKLDGPTN